MLDSTLAKCMLVTGSLWECLRVVGPESPGGQIPAFSGPMQWPSGAPGSTWECQRQAWVPRRHTWEHLRVPTTSLDAPTNCLGAPTTSMRACRITVEQFRNNIISGNTAGAPANHSYYSSFNDFQNSCIQSVFSSMYLCIYLHTVYLDWLKAEVESNARWAWRWRLSKLRDTLGDRYLVNLQSFGGRDWASLEMHLKAMIEWVWIYTGRRRSSELRDKHGGRNVGRLKMHLE